MFDTLIRSAAVLAVLAGVTSAAQQPAAPAAAGASALPRPPSDGAIASTLAQWKALRETDALPFDSYAGFLLAHPGWPGEAANRRAAERQAAMGMAAPANLLRYFARFPAQSAAGSLAEARALQASGRPYGDAARRAWKSSGLSAADEATLLANFGSALTPADHDARADALLWAGQTSAAARILPYASAAQRPILAARLSFRTNAPDASALSSATAEQYRGDPGYLADRATWLRNSGAGPSARTWLARTRSLQSRPGNVEKWYEVLLVAARGAAADGQDQLAYDIARQVDDAYPAGTDVSKKPYGERDDYTSLAWLAGQSAMRLGRSADAMVMFDRYGRASLAPQTRAKGFYWAGRAAEAASLSAERDSFLAQAAGYRDQFYGQLAAERTGRPLVAPPPVNAASVAPATRAAFEAREPVAAARFLARINSHDDLTYFVRQIAADATTDTDHLLAADLAGQIARPDLAVMVGRSAAQNGLSDYSATGYPIVPVPVGYESSWTMIHAIARQESQFDRAAVSSAGARGLMQLMPGTAREQAGKLGLTYDQGALTTDPSLSMMLGSSYFQRVFGIYGSYPLALAAYNAGPGNVNKWLRANGDPRTGQVDWLDWIEKIPLSETRGYVQRVTENAVVYDLMNPARARSRGPNRISWYLGKNRPG